MPGFASFCLHALNYRSTYNYCKIFFYQFCLLILNRSGVLKQCACTCMTNNGFRMNMVSLAPSFSCYNCTLEYCRTSNKYSACYLADHVIGAKCMNFL